MDQPMLRLWDYYLAYCEAGFRAGRTELLQLLLAARGAG
jgi:cyclopropane-fatty-acyl-phospholipid synthase